MADGEVDVRIPFGVDPDSTLEARHHSQGAAVAIVCHPHPAFGGRIDNPIVTALTSALAARRLSTLRFSFRGIGQSDGTPTGGIAEPDDVRAVVAWTRAHYSGPLALVGYSFGALMALKALANGETADVLAALGLPTRIVGDHADRIADVTRALAQPLPMLFLQGEADPFCELDRLTAWTAPHPPRITVETWPGEGHFFPTSTEKVAARISDYVAGQLLR